jgi:chromosome segregation ATPase
MTRLDAETWLKSALNPLNLQIKEHEKVLAKRIENFKKIRDNITSVEDRIKQLEKLRVELESQAQVLSGIKVSLDGERTVAKVEPEPALEEVA